MSENGKGSRRRKIQVDQNTWDKNYERIFGKKQKKSSLAVDKSIKRDTIQRSKREDQSRD
jgi:hypothetical protein